MGVEIITRKLNDSENEITVKGIPPYSQLEKKVNKVVRSSSWMDRYGWDWSIHLVGLAFLPVGLLLLTSSRIPLLLLGFFIYGKCHSILSSKAGHMATHGAACDSAAWSRFWSWFFVEFVGNFSEVVGYDVHVRQHHPYTNIIGLGDSSMWRLPCLPRLVYLFVTPLAIPAITPLVAFAGLWGQWRRMLTFSISVSVALALLAWPLVTLGAYSYLGAFCVIFAARAVYAINFLHLNIFQHIGLPMYNQTRRPTRLFQMTSGVMSVDRHPLLDWAFGHSLVSCHVEHHLFPRLSDNMCLKIKPLVRDYLVALGVPYNQRPYMERLRHFYNNYDDLIVRAPPITHFVGIQ